jgi:choline dehydrogenase-like flavoprotein
MKQSYRIDNMELQNSFTHVVVGAGSAGCVLTAHIAENPSFNVVLLEAGPDCQGSNAPCGTQDIRRVPMKGQAELFDDRIDWNVRVELPDGGRMNVPQAKVAGGGSSINGGTALRNTVGDCKEWVELGNDAWAWSNVEPVYVTLEYGEIKGMMRRHPLVRTKPEEAGKIQKAFIASAIDCGLSWTEDLNVTGIEGSGASPVCREGQRRISAANTFIDPIRHKTNLTIMTNALVDRILFSGWKATGVILTDGRQISACAEVILSAGAIFSPALLQRSGIGPASLLSSLSIPVIQDLPVGANLADHPCIPVVAYPKPKAYVETDFSLQMQARWSSTFGKGAVDLQMVCFSYLYSAPSLSKSEQPTLPMEAQRNLGGTASGQVAGIGCNVNKPTSNGSVRIQSRDPKQQPLIAPNYLTTASDRARAREAVRLAHRIILSEPMQSVLSPPLGLTLEITASDGLLDNWIQSQYSSTYHFTSTCRMAARERGGVVDQSGCVYGVQGLRVADASVIPTIPAANTMWTTMMFAKRIGRCVRDGTLVTSDR